MRETVNDAYVGAGLPGQQGATPGRALTLLDRLYRDGAIAPELWLAGLDLRNMILKEWPKSEGVSSYGSNVEASEPSSKADRVGKYLTGFSVSRNGKVDLAGRRRSYRNARELEDLMFACCGLHDREGEKLWNLKLVELLIRVATHSESMPTLTQITLELTSHYGAKSKQAPPYALGVIRTLLERAARHLRYVK